MEPSIPFNIALFMEEKIKERGITVKRLSELSGISQTHLEDLVNGKLERLPPAPYLRGYIMKLAPLLEFDAEAVWQELRRMSDINRSGPEDRLPGNRFARKSPMKYIIGGGVVLLVLWYLGSHLSTILGKPILQIDAPQEMTTMTSANRITFRGALKNATMLTLNGETISISPLGTWEKEVALQPGLNTIQLEASKALGGKTSIIRQVFFTQPEQTPTATTTPKTP